MAFWQGKKKFGKADGFLNEDDFVQDNLSWEEDAKVEVMIIKMTFGKAKKFLAKQMTFGKAKKFLAKPMAF